MELKMMNREALIEKFELELRQAVIDYETGNTISLEDLDWGIPFQISESRGEYRATKA